MRSTPFFEPAPLELVPGPSLSGNPPTTASAKIRMFIPRLSDTKLILGVRFGSARKSNRAPSAAARSAADLGSRWSLDRAQPKALPNGVCEILVAETIYVVALKLRMQIETLVLATLAGFRPNLPPGPLPTDQARQMVKNAPKSIP